MGSFMVYGLNGHELMSLEQVFKKPAVEKVSPVNGGRPLKDGDKPPQLSQQRAKQAYSAVQKLAETSPVLLAEEIMTAPVTTLNAESAISEAIKIFSEKMYRHFPIISQSNRLVGVLSDRDILRYMAGVTEQYRQTTFLDTASQVKDIMIPRVLTANIGTDLRYVARLFVEQHVGSMPIMKNGELQGIITRSDLLKAVMRHYTLELWV